MPPDGLVQFFSTVGIGGLLAWGMFLAYRRDVLRGLEGWRAQSEQLLDVVRQNTSAVTELTVLLRESVSRGCPLVTSVTTKHDRERERLFEAREP